MSETRFLVVLVLSRLSRVLMCLDQLLSAFAGRQCMIHEEKYEWFNFVKSGFFIHSCTFKYSYDVDLPIECDDEYWDHPDPTLCFKQPEGKPSAIAFFNCYLKLMNILAYVMGIVVSYL